MPKNIYIFDFDKTFTVLHTRGFVVFQSEADKIKYINEFVLTNTRNLARIKRVFKRIIDEGHRIAMASFAQTPSVKTIKTLDEYKNLAITEQNILGGKELILVYLDAVFGKDRPFLPANDIQAFWAPDKNTHIARIISHFYPNPANSIENNRVVLIDDEIKNIETAKAAGYRAIHVTQDDTYLDLIEADLNSHFGPKHKEVGSDLKFQAVFDVPPRLMSS